MYINGFIIPVQADKKAEYQNIAERFWEIARDYGAIEQVEAWEADVKDGKWTDFRRAVDLKDGEAVVFSWVIWKDKAAADASQETMMADERMKQFSGEMPFDGKRMVFGGFSPLVVRGR
jgi:uncharacterized protein YbaA (DUF1428 family)